MGAMLGVLAVPRGEVAAQEGAVVLELGAARALPPTGVALDAATYAVGGARLEWNGVRSVANVGAMAGWAMDGTGGDFVSGGASGRITLAAAGPVELGMGGAVEGFTVRAPLLYRVWAADARPFVRLTGSGASLAVRGRFGTGASRIELRRRDGSVRRGERGLGMGGVDAELGLGSGAFGGSATVGVYRARGERFRRAGVRALVGAGTATLAGEVGVWDTPQGPEWHGGVTLSILVGRLRASAGGGRSAPDPLTLVEPGFQASVVVGLRAFAFGGGRARGAYEILDSGPGSSVRVRVELPQAQEVALLGDFTDWEAIPMRRDGSHWSVEMRVGPGTYHFGFLVDGEWWIPEGVQGMVPDDWGRANATMVVPTEEGEP